MKSQRDVWLSEASEHHQAGAMEAAEHCYALALAARPSLPPKLLAQVSSNYGVVLQALGSNEQALHAYDFAIAARTDYAEAHINRGVLLAGLGRFAEALSSYDLALQFDPANTEAHFNKGVALQTIGESEAALCCYDAAIVCDPSHSLAHNNRANILQGLGRSAEALLGYEQAIASQPDYAEAFYGMGMVLLSEKHTEAAALCLEQAIAKRPDFALAHFMMGRLLQEAGRDHAALVFLERAIAQDPGMAAAHGLRGVICQEFKRTADAIASYQAAIAANPRYVQALVNLGSLLFDNKQPLEALALFDRALLENSDFVEAHFNRGRVLQSLDRLDDALQSFKATLERDATFKYAHYNIGLVLHRQGNIAQALQAYEAALAIDPAYEIAHWNCAIAQLQLGKLREGFEGYECRWQVPGLRDAARKFTQPLWLGDETLQGKSIVLHVEQGFGDTLHMFRYVPMVTAMGAKVFVIVQKSLASLLEHNYDDVTILTDGDIFPEFDYHCPLLSLPLAFKTEESTIPAQLPYVSVKKAVLEKWSERLDSLIPTMTARRPRIGLVWSGNADHKNDVNRSIALQDLLRVLPQDIEYYSLQKDVRQADQTALETSRHLKALGTELENFEDTAAAALLMDMVISVDTSVAHLCGALNVPLWLLLPLQPDWRWMLERTDSPWYPSAHLWRQDRLGDWGPTLARMGAQLQANASALKTRLWDVPKAVTAPVQNPERTFDRGSLQQRLGAGVSTPACPVCGSSTTLFDVVDFNKSCEEANGLRLPLAGVGVYYARCGGCGFCFAPDLCAWPVEAFAQHIYNAGYAQVDPDYLEHRPLANAAQLQALASGTPPKHRHLDYGGGNGLLSRTLQAAGWNSASYDPFANPDVEPASLGRFDFITAFEVFEHVPDPHALVAVLKELLADTGVVYFSTLLSDDEIKEGGGLGWWYVAPRNGHISLYTRESLSTLGRRHSLQFVSLSPVSHLFISGQPKWARKMFSF